MRNDTDAKTPVPPYVSFKTFRSGIQALREHGLPPEIDRSVWASKSGADQVALLSSFRFLGLIDQSGHTQSALHQLVNVAADTQEEKKVLGDILRSRYDKPFELDLGTATPHRFADVMGSYGAHGSTRDRAIRFFIKAASHCGIKLSGRLTARLPRATPTSNGSTKRTRRQTQREPRRTPAPTDDDGDTAMKTVELANAGGQLTLSGTFNPFELTGKERQLVYDIIDKMKELEDSKDNTS